jgi:hypothetical protein
LACVPRNIVIAAVQVFRLETNMDVVVVTGVVFDTHVTGSVDLIVVEEDLIRTHVDRQLD